MKNYYNYIEAYHRNELGEKDLEEFEAAMQKDAELKEATDQYPNIAPMLDLMLEEDIRNSLDKVKSKPRPRKLWIPISIAAGILIIALAAGWLWSSNNPTGEDLYAEFYRAPLSEDSRNTENPITKSDEGLRYLQAHELLSNNDVEEAIEIFTTFSQDPNSEYQERSEWFLVLAALRKGDLEKARTLLNEIQTNSSHLYFQKAEQLAKKLNK